MFLVGSLARNGRDPPNDMLCQYEARHSMYNSQVDLDAGRIVSFADGGKNYIIIIIIEWYLRSTTGSSL